MPKTKKVAKAAKSVKKPSKSAKPVAKKVATKPVKKAASKVAAKKAAKKTAKPVKKAAPKAAKKSSSPLKSLKSLVNQLLPKKAAEDLKKNGKKDSVKATAKVSAKKEKVIKAKEEVVEVVVEAKVVQQELILTDAEGRRLCKVKDCDQPAVVEGYCRYHYLFFWKKIQNRKKILSEGKLEQYIEELTARYPLKFIELIRKDLGTEADFMGAIQELDIDEGNNIDDFEDENFMEEVRGMSSGAASGNENDRVDDDF